MNGTVIGVITAPMLVPALNSPVANARSRRGNHSATVLIAAGKLPDSPRPSRKRTNMKPATDEEYDSPKPPRTNATPGPNRVASAVAIAASDQMISASENPLLDAEPIDDPAGEQEADRVGELEREDDVAVVDLASSRTRPAASA